jgi:phosphoglycolate phosphatase
MPHLLFRGRPLRAEGTGATASIDAVLFDKDGTLSHSEPTLEVLGRVRVRECLLRAGQAAALGDSGEAELETLLLRAYGLDDTGVHPAGSLAVAARDHNLLATATALTQMGLGWPDSLAIAEEVFARTDHLHGGEADVSPPATEGLAPLLDSLRREGVRCAVISNDHEQGIRSFMRGHGLGEHFSACWSADHHPRKPDPAAVHALCRKLGVAPDRCALIGDADSDLRMGRQAGVAVVLGYRAGWRKPVRLDPAFPQLEHWRDLTVEASQDSQPVGNKLTGHATDSRE